MRRVRLRHLLDYFFGWRVAIFIEIFELLIVAIMSHFENVEIFYRIFIWYKASTIARDSLQPLSRITSLSDLVSSL
jgi:hypothetical protein